MISVICDRCGALMPPAGEIGYLAWNFREGLDGPMRDENVLEENHYCRACMEAVRKYIEAGPGGDSAEPDPEEKKEPEEKPKAARSRVDKGKVLALDKAGWNARDIADDMGISLQSVYNVLKQRKAE